MPPTSTVAHPPCVEGVTRRPNPPVSAFGAILGSPMYLYALAEPDTGEIRYIGKTEDTVKRRLSKHMAPSSLRRKCHRTDWISSLKKRGMKPALIVLAEAELSEHLAAEEVAMIAFCRSVGFRLVNNTDGGEGASGFRHSAEKIAEMKVIQAGLRDVKSTAIRDALRDPAERARRSELMRKLWGDPVFKENQKRRIAESQLPWSDDRRISASRSNGGFPIGASNGKVYDTIRAAARALNLSAGNIAAVLAGRRKHCGGLAFWRVK